MKHGIICGKVCGKNLNAFGTQLGSLLNQLLNQFAFWSKEDDNNYYASLEDGSVYYSITEKE